MKATPASPLSASTGYRLIKLGETALDLADAALEPLGISGRQLNVLSTAAAHPTLSQREVSTTLGIDPNVLVGVIDELERRGLAHRRRSDVDRRRHVLEVTTAGHEVIARGHVAVQAAEDQLLGQLSARQRQALHALCGLLLELPSGAPP